MRELGGQPVDINEFSLPVVVEVSKSRKPMNIYQ